MPHSKAYGFRCRERRPRSAVCRTHTTRLRYGSRDEVRERVAALEAAGAQRLMLQWLEPDDVDGIAARRMATPVDCPTDV